MQQIDNFGNVPGNTNTRDSDEETLNALQAAINNVNLDTALRIEISNTGRLHYYVRFEDERSGNSHGAATGMTLTEALHNAMAKHSAYLDITDES